MENVAFAHISKWYFGNVQQVMLNVIYQTLQSKKYERTMFEL